MPKPYKGSGVDNRTEKRRFGDIGEKIACEFLRRRGFSILETNYLKKWGEIDIVAKKGSVMRFIEVKSARLDSTPHEARQVSDGTFTKGGQGEVTYGTPLGEPTGSKVREGTSVSHGTYRPEDNMHPAKLGRLFRTIQSYMLDKKLDCEFQLDLVTVKIDMTTRQARVEIIENIVI